MTPAKARTVEFVAVPVTDDGDFYWRVDRATFLEVTGRDPEPDEVVARGKCRLYPAQTAAALRVNRKVRVRLVVTPI